MNAKRFAAVLTSLARILLIAALYYLTARLGFLIALPPGNVTALWPPSGLALAAVFIWGWPMGLGVFGGSLLVNLGILNGPAALPVAAAIAAGSSLQAWLAAWLLRRFVRVLPPETIRQTLLAIAITTISSLLAAGLGVASLCNAGFAAWNNYAALFGTWWLGDLIGMLVFAPVLITFSIHRHDKKLKEPLLWPLASCILGLALFVFCVVQNAEQERISASLQRDTGEMTHTLQNALDRNLQDLAAIRAFYSSSREVDREEFHNFTGQLLGNGSALLAYAWSPSISRAELPAYQAAIRAQGLPDFYVFEKAANGSNQPVASRPGYFPITMIEPAATNQAAVGFDLGSNPERLQAIQKARDSGQPAASPALRLVQDAGNETSILVMIPIYRNGAATGTQAERRASLLGLANQSFHLNDWMRNALEAINRHDIELYLYDIGDPQTPQFLAFYPSITGRQSLPAGQAPVPGSLENGIFYTDKLKIADREWLVITRAGAGYGPDANHWVAWLSLLIGLALAGVFLTYVNIRQKAENTLRRKEAEYRLIAENTGDVISILDVETQKFTYMSPSVKKLGGYAPEQVIGSPLSAVLTPDSFQKFLLSFPERLEDFNRTHAARTHTDEFDQIRKDGSVVITEVASTFAFNEAGRLQVVAISRDISERKQAEELLRKQSEQLRILFEASQRLNRTLDLDEVYQAVCDFMSSMAPNDNLIISAFDEQTQLITCRACWMDNRWLDVGPVPPIPLEAEGRGTQSVVIRTGQSWLINDFQAYIRSAQHKYYIDENTNEVLEEVPDDAEVMRSALIVPLKNGDKVTGVLQVLSSKLDAYNENHLKLLEALSVHIVSAEKNALLYAQMQAELKQRKRADNALQKSQAGLEMAQSIAHLGSWDIDLASGAGVWSREMWTLYQRDAALGVPSCPELLEIVHPDDRQTLLDAQQRAIETGALVTVEYRITPQQGELRYIKANIQPIPDEQGLVTRLSGTALDITEIKMAQQELLELNRDLEKRVEERTAQVRQSEAVYRALFENSNDGIFLMSPEGVELQANQRGIDMLGYEKEEWKAVSNDQVIAPEQQQDADIRFQAVLRGEQVPLYERTFMAKGGKRLDVEVNLSAVRDTEGKISFVQSVVRDVTERKKAEETLRDSEERYRKAISAADEVPYSLDYATNTYTFMGEGIERITGYTRDEITPQLFDSFIQETHMRGELASQQTRESTRLIRSGQMEPGTVWRSDFLIHNKAGEHRWLSDSSVQVLGPAGQVIGSIGILQDITERKIAEEALRESRDKLSAANAALEKASRLKDEFLASMSHELRTPLTGILGLSEALQMQAYGALNEKQLKSVKNIEISGRHLLELINDILDLSKIEAGKLEMIFEPCALRDVCQASLQLVKGMAHQKQQIISFEMQPESIHLRGDARRLKQMLVNLLSNAVKFTPAGGQLGLEVCGDPQQRLVRLTVWDKGIGIQAEDLRKLFKPFVQLDSSLARQYAGTGLGLSLVQRMAELHGGSIQAESVPGEGSRFSILLPWSAGVTKPLSDPLGRMTEPMKNILVIEDNTLDAELMIRYLTELGIASLVQSTLRDALEKAAFLRPSAILLDLNLPDGSGMDFLGRLKADERTRDIPVIIVSVEERRSEALKLGASGYLLKPFAREDLRAEMTKAAAFMHTSDPVMIISTPKLVPMVMIADDNELILETLSDFLETRDFRVISTRSGYELLERANELHPDIILMDIQMPGLDGLETTRRLRAHSDPLLAKTPVIAITALAMSGDREKCLQAGANEYMSKPVSMARLVECINEILTG